MPFTPQDALQRAIEHREIFFDEMVELMRQVMKGEVSPVMTAAILTGLRVKKETVGEIAGAATVMREFSRTVEVPDRSRLVDIVGTGGDGSHTFNISTCSMFVAAAAGARGMLLGVLDGAPGPAREIVALNAAAALYVAGVAVDIADGLARARAAIDSGAARQAQSDFVRTTRELAAA